MNLVKDSLVFIRAREGDCETLGSESASTSNSVEVRVSAFGHVVVEDNVDLLNVNASPEDLCGDQNAVLELLESFIDLDSLLLWDVTMDGFAWDGILDKYFSKFHGVLDRFDEDDDLIELKLINQVHQLGNLLTLIKLDIVLAETVEG